MSEQFRRSGRRPRRGRQFESGLVLQIGKMATGDGVGARIAARGGEWSRISRQIWPMRHNLGTKSRVHPRYIIWKHCFQVYRVSNWSEYDRALVQRGDVTLWISETAVTSWKPAPTGRRGAQRKFSDHAIELALTLRLVLRLPLRQAEGFLRSILSLMSIDLEAPDHSTLFRRSQSLNVDLHRVGGDKPIHLIVDSTGLSIVGEGEWAIAKYGDRGRRGWKKLHLGVDRSGVIVAQALTHGSADDAKAALDLIDEIEGDIASFTADAAYDTIAIYEAAASRGARVVIPPIKTATKPRQRGSRPHARDRTIIGTSCGRSGCSE